MVVRSWKGLVYLVCGLQVSVQVSGLSWGGGGGTDRGSAVDDGVGNENGSLLTPNEVDYDVQTYAERVSAFIYNLGDIPQKWRPYLSTNICDLNGTWELMLSKSDPLDSILQAMGISWFKRKALRSYVSTTHIHVVSPLCPSLPGDDLSWVPPPKMRKKPRSAAEGKASSFGSGPKKDDKDAKDAKEAKDGKGDGDEDDEEDEESFILENPLGFPEDFPDSPPWGEDEAAEEWFEGMEMEGMEAAPMDGVANPQHYVRFTTLFPFRTRKTGILSVNASAPFDYHDQDTGVWSTLADYVGGRLLQRRVSKKWGVMFDVRAVILPGAFATPLRSTAQWDDDEFEPQVAQIQGGQPESEQADSEQEAGQEAGQEAEQEGEQEGGGKVVVEGGDGETFLPPKLVAAELVPPEVVPRLAAEFMAPHNVPFNIGLFNEDRDAFESTVLNAMRDIELTEDVVLTPTPLMIFRWSLATPEGQVIITDRWNRKVL